MNIDDSKKMEQVMQMQMISQVFKSVTKNSNTFQLMMESLLSAVKDSEGNIDLSRLGLGEQDLSKLGYGGGERLNSAFKDIASFIDEDGANKSDISRIEMAVDKASRKYGIDRNLILAVIKQESDFQPDSTSWAGAMGLMQLMPVNVEELGVKDPYNIEDNVDGGTRHLKDMLQMYGNSKELALAAYNAGCGTLSNRNVTDVSGISRLPYETRDYVKKVMKYYGK